VDTGSREENASKPEFETPENGDAAGPQSVKMLGGTLPAALRGGEVNE
jgi:hypothetical protein